MYQQHISFVSASFELVLHVSNTVYMDPWQTSNILQEQNHVLEEKLFTPPSTLRISQELSTRNLPRIWRRTAPKVKAWRPNLSLFEGAPQKKDMWVCLKIVYIYTHIPESPNHMIDRHFPVFKGPPYVWCKSHTFFPHFQIKDSIGPKEAAAHHGSCQECERIAVIRPAMGEFGAGLSCHAMQNVMVAEGPREFRQRCAGWCATTMETKQRKHVWAGAHWL